MTTYSLPPFSVGDQRPNLDIVIRWDGELVLEGATAQIYIGSYNQYDPAAPFSGELLIQASITSPEKSELICLYNVTEIDTALPMKKAISCRVTLPSGEVQTRPWIAHIQVIPK